MPVYSKTEPHPGDLRHLVEIGITVNVVNANGYSETTDTVLCSVWASVTDISSRQTQSADSSVMENGILFGIRFREEIRPGMWVRFLDVKWTISALEGFGYKRRYLGLKAYSAKGVSG